MKNHHKTKTFISLWLAPGCLTPNDWNCRNQQRMLRHKSHFHLDNLLLTCRQWLVFTPSCLHDYVSKSKVKSSNQLQGQVHQLISETKHFLLQILIIQHFQTNKQKQCFPWTCSVLLRSCSGSEEVLQLPPSFFSAQVNE